MKFISEKVWLWQESEKVSILMESNFLFIWNSSPSGLSMFRFVFNQVDFVSEIEILIFSKEKTIPFVRALPWASSRFWRDFLFDD